MNFTDMSLNKSARCAFVIRIACQIMRSGALAASLPVQASHISVPLTGDVTTTRGFSFQFSDSGLTIGTRAAGIDNLVLQGGGFPSKTVVTVAALPVVGAPSAGSKQGLAMLANGNFAAGLTNQLLPLSTEWKKLHFRFATPWSDNDVRISFTDLGATIGQTYWLAKCSLVAVSELSMSVTSASAATGSPAPGTSFVWKGDCSSEAAFVASHHPTIPGHYEYLPDPQEPARGIVFMGHLTPDFKTRDPEKFHIHPEIYFEHFIPGNISVSFDVKVDDLVPSELGPYGQNPWLNIVTIFDETTVAGGSSFHPSVMVNLVGTPGHYRLQAYAMDRAGAGTFYPQIEGAPAFPTGQWVTVRVEANVTTKQVQVYQNNLLASTGPYLGKLGLAGAHMGLYANRKMTRATVFNSNINIRVNN